MLKSHLCHFWADDRSYNVALLGLAFMLIFTAYSTTAYTSRNALASAIVYSNGTYQGDVYLASSIIFITLSISNWIAPFLLTVFGVKLALFLGSTTYCFYVASFIYPLEWTLYSTAVLLGIGGGVFWTAQGVLMSDCSDDSTLTRNTAVFWLIYFWNLIFGNIIEYILLHGQSEFDPDTRVTLFSILTILSIAGCLLILFLRRIPAFAAVHKISLTECEQLCGSIFNHLERSWNLLKTRDMLCLSFFFAYTGTSVSFRDGILPACVGQNLNFEDPKATIGMMGFCVGLAELSSFIAILVFEKNLTRRGHYHLVIICLVVHSFAYGIAYLTFPDDCTVTESKAPTYFKSRVFALVAASLLGIGDSCLITASYGIIGRLYKNSKLLPSAYALSLFMQCLCSAVAYFFASASFTYQILVVITMNLASAISFIYVEISTKERYT